MTLLQAWGDSLSLLKPQNLKLFLLVTLKSIIEAYKVLMRYWWWLYAIMAVCCFITIPLTALISPWAFQILFFATIASTRPSLFQKDGAYFKDIMRYFALVIPLLLVLPYAWWPATYSMLYLLWVLFFLDSRRKIVSQDSDVIHSFLNALKMVIYNLPLLLIVHLARIIILLVLFMLIALLMDFFMVNLIIKYTFSGFATINASLAWQNLLSIILAPVFICLYTNIYIKKLHDQFDLYFKQPK
jgi:hypothetical protein